ncbi:MAG: beta-galactosidase [Verrucomicrobia bacterium]|nr:beta-galactosidase [Verrucomicrobiota bacterium]
MTSPSTGKNVRFCCDRVYHGGDYNPDQWPESVWQEDVALMRQASVNIATLPVFGWQALNPAEGVFAFEWLDRVIEKLDSAGIDLCLATATASQPAWLDQKYPDALAWDEHGRERPHGNRHTFCPNSPNLRRLGADLVRALAVRYGKHPRLKLWHINNEYGGSWPSYCYCPRCAEAFRGWLQERHGSLDALNAHWNTAFWGHTYQDWSQVEPPYATGEGAVNCLRIDWRRFHTDSILACFRNEAAVLREITPEVPLTTNLMGPFFSLNYRAWAEDLDVVAWDSYPMWDDPAATTAFKHALMRGLRGGEPFLLLEQSPSHQNWAPSCRLKRPGELRQLSYQAMAQGSDSVMYFQWRQSRGCIEKYHGAILEHHGRSDARVFREVSALGGELAALGNATLGGRVPARVAVVFDWESWWALAASSGPRRDLDYLTEVLPYYSALHAAGIQTEVVGLDDDLDRFDVIVTPWTTMMTAAQAKRITARVRSGATLVATHFTARVDAHDLMHEGGAPGPLRKVLGLTVEEFDSLPAGETNGVRYEAAVGPLVTADTEASVSFLCERLWLHTAVPMARYTSDFYAGEPAITLNHFGLGRAYYLAAKLEPVALGILLRSVCAEHGVTSPLAKGVSPPDGVEVTVRAATGRELVVYVINHASADRTVVLPLGAHRDLLTGDLHRGQATLAPRGILLLQPILKST